MENSTVSKKEAQEKAKEKAKQTSHTAFRVSKETARAVTLDLAKINKKDYGRHVNAADYLALAITLVKPEHLSTLQEGSLSNQDRFERDYAAHCAEHGKVSKDEYLGMRMRGEILTSLCASKNSEKSA